MSLFDLLPVAIDLDLKHPVTGDLLGKSLKVVGPDSSQFRASIKAAFMRKAALAGKQDSLEALEAESTDLIASTIVGWSDDAYFGGSYTSEAARAIVANPGFSWLRGQLEEFVQDSKRFFR